MKSTEFPRAFESIKTISMLTRAGVAKRLGKSIATVRRIEGVELHPTSDERGVHHFDPDEVDAVATGEITRVRGHRMRGFEDYRRTLELQHQEMLAEEQPAEEDRRRRHEQEQHARDELIRDEVARQVAKQMEQFEKARTLERVLNLIREGAEAMDDDELDNWWEIVRELAE